MHLLLSPFTVEETETQGSWVNCSNLHSWWRIRTITGQPLTEVEHQRAFCCINCGISEALEILRDYLLPWPKIEPEIPTSGNMPIDLRHHDCKRSTYCLGKWKRNGHPTLCQLYFSTHPCFPWNPGQFRQVLHGKQWPRGPRKERAYLD